MISNEAFTKKDVKKIPSWLIRGHKSGHSGGPFFFFFTSLRGQCMDRIATFRLPMEILAPFISWCLKVCILLLSILSITKMIFLHKLKSKTNNSPAQSLWLRPLLHHGVNFLELYGFNGVMLMQTRVSNRRGIILKNFISCRHEILHTTC